MKAKIAVALWLVLAFVVWNVVFDRTLVLAGRRYSYAAAVSFRQRGVYLRIDDWMGPARAHGVRLASASAGAVGLLGLTAVALASRRDDTRRRHDERAVQRKRDQ